MKITGEFEVKMAPLETCTQGVAEIQLGRMSLHKVFKGALSGESRGEMLSAMTPTEGSAGYVAVEQVSGTLAGKKGSFVLMHYGVMDRGSSHLTLEVIPDSGAGELQNLRGKMKIDVKDGKHFYEFDYEL